MRYLIYSRVSTQEQDTKTQISKCRHLVSYLNGSEIIEFSDPNHSTSLPMDKREGLQKMLSSLIRGDVVVVYNVDRLGRDVIECATLYRLITKDKKSLLITPDQPNGVSEFHMNLLVSFAQEEKRRIIERTTDKLLEKQSRMEKVGACWYGYTTDPTKLQLTKEKAPSYNKPYLLIPDQREKQQVDLMIDLYNRGYSYGRITAFLNDEGHKNRKGNPVDKSTVYRVLKRHQQQNSIPNRLVVA